MEQSRVVTTYAMRNRYVPHALYDAIKRRKECKLCGRKMKGKERLQVHHKIPVSQGGKSDYQNCIGICKHCHEKIHQVKK